MSLCGTIALDHQERFSSVTTVWSRILQRQMSTHRKNSNTSAERQSHPSTRADQQTPLMLVTGAWNHNATPVRHLTITKGCLLFPPLYFRPPRFPLVPIHLGRWPQMENETVWCTSTFGKSHDIAKVKQPPHIPTDMNQIWVLWNAIPFRKINKRKINKTCLKDKGTSSRKFKMQVLPLERYFDSVT